jgi:rSAM/selenodomain-associated transferase 2
MSSTTVSFIIPVLNEMGRIGPLLAALASRYPHSQRLVVDGGSTDATAVEAGPHCHRLIDSKAGRALQMNTGAKAATGDYLFFLHADTLPLISEKDLLEALGCAPKWGFSPVKLSGSQAIFRLVERAMNIRSRLSRVATGDQMLFIQRELFETTGGFAALPLMEDIEYCKRLRRIAQPLVLRAPVETSSRRWEQRGIGRTILRMWVLRLAFVCGVSPQRLQGHYSID